MAAFSINQSVKVPTTALYSTPEASGFSYQQAAGETSNTPSESAPAGGITTTDPGWFPKEIPNLRRFESGESLKTINIPAGAGHAQMIFYTDNKRPLHAQVELWLGPIRRMHNMEIYNESGGPFRAILSLKKQAQSIKVGSLAKSGNYPFYAGISIPSEEQSAKIANMIPEKFASAELKDKVQGTNTDGEWSAVRTFNIPATAESVQVICWSKFTGGKSLRAKIEMNQGPNNPKQTYTLQCSGSYQPYTCVIPTPGPGWSLRIKNSKFVEDGLFEVAIIPYDITPAAEEKGLNWI